MYFISELLMYKDLECMKCSRDIKCSFVFAAESVMGIYSIKTISHMIDIAEVLIETSAYSHKT